MSLSNDQSLPLQWKLKIRDCWTDPESAVQKALKGLQDHLGLKIAIQPEWSLLRTELAPTYPADSCVKVVAGVVRVWAQCTRELLEDDAFAETLLEKAGLRLRCQVDVSSADSVSLTWSDTLSGFVIQLPRKQVIRPENLYCRFPGLLKEAFHPSAQTKGTEDQAANDWADVAVDGTTGAARVIDKQAAGLSQVDYFPVLDDIPRSAELLLSPPYRLTVYDRGSSRIEVQGGHSPSLKLLADFLKRESRVNHNDTRSPPAVDVQLHQLSFGLAEMFDRVVISTEGNRYSTQFHVTTPIVLAFVERVLGYDCVSDRPGEWIFRRDTAFKTARYVPV